MKRGLANSDSETRERVARSGGTAVHESRGLETVDPVIRSKIASLGGKARAKAIKAKQND